MAKVSKTVPWASKRGLRAFLWEVLPQVGCDNEDRDDSIAVFFNKTEWEREFSPAKSQIMRHFVFVLDADTNSARGYMDGKEFGETLVAEGHGERSRLQLLLQ